MYLEMHPFPIRCTTNVSARERVDVLVVALGRISRGDRGRRRRRILRWSMEPAEPVMEMTSRVLKVPESPSIPDNVRWRMISLAANTTEFTFSIRTLTAQHEQHNDHYSKIEPFQTRRKKKKTVSSQITYPSLLLINK